MALNISVAVLLSTAASPQAASTSTSAYTAYVERFEAQRLDLARAYRRASPKARARIVGLARREVLKAVTNQLAPAWYGTPWRYSGRTRLPQGDAIACGTFVATLLRDAGFRLNRIAMGRLASEHIALSLTSNANVRRYRRRSAETVARDVEAWGPGLYVLGLDYHAALVHVDGRRRSHVIHSSYYAERVLAEPLVDELGFRLSQYRVVAKLLDDTMMKAWLRGQRFEATAR